MVDDEIKIVEPACWTFLFEEPDNGWWLKISNGNDLINYHNKTMHRWQDCITDYLQNKEKYDKTGRYDSFDSKLTYAIMMYAEQRKLSMIDAVMQFRMKVASEQLEAIHQYGYIVINKSGGYHSGPIEYSQFVHRKTFIWPDFKESDIRISKQPGGGTHYYVYIGDMELHEGENIKWMSESDARMAAKRYISKEDE